MKKLLKKSRQNFLSAAFLLFFFWVKRCVTRPNDFSLLIVLGVIPTALSVLSRKRKLLSEETCTLIFISRYSRLLSPFRTVEHYYTPVTITITSIVLNRNQAFEWCISILRFSWFSRPCRLHYLRVVYFFSLGNTTQTPCHAPSSYANYQFTECHIQNQTRHKKDAQNAQFKASFVVSK